MRAVAHHVEGYGRGGVRNARLRVERRVERWESGRRRGHHGIVRTSGGLEPRLSEPPGGGVGPGLLRFDGRGDGTRRQLGVAGGRVLELRLRLGRGRGRNRGRDFLDRRGRGGLGSTRLRRAGIGRTRRRSSCLCRIRSLVSRTRCFLGLSPLCSSILEPDLNRR